MISSGLRWLLLLAGVWLLQGCSLFNVSSASYYRDGEGRFNADVFESIEPHATTNNWLTQHFGKPFWVDKADHDVAIHTWQFARERHKRKDVLLVLRYRSVREDVKYLHVVTQHNVVIKHWLDRYASVDVDRVIYALGLEVPPKSMPNETSTVSQALPASDEPPSRLQASRTFTETLPTDGHSTHADEPGVPPEAATNAEEVALPQVPEPVQALNTPDESIDVQKESSAARDTTTNSMSQATPVAPMVKIEASTESSATTDVPQNLYGI